MSSTLPPREEFEATLTTREALLETLRGLEADINSVVAGVDEERFVRPGSFEALSLKDLIAHLTYWRVLTAERLEAGLAGREPVMPWPAPLDEDDDVDAVNLWIYNENLGKSSATIMAESADTFVRCAAAIAAMPQEGLFDLGYFAWAAEFRLAPAVISGTYYHFHEDHEPEIRAWLAASAG